MHISYINIFFISFTFSRRAYIFIAKKISWLKIYRMSAQYRYLYFVYALKNISVKYESKWKKQYYKKLEINISLVY